MRNLKECLRCAFVTMKAYSDQGLFNSKMQFNLKLFIFIQLIFIQLNFVFQYIVVLRFFDQNSYFYTNNYFNSMKRERNGCVCQHDLTIYSANELFQRLHFNLNPRLGKCVVVLIEKNKGRI